VVVEAETGVVVAVAAAMVVGVVDLVVAEVVVEHRILTGN